VSPDERTDPEYEDELLEEDRQLVLGDLLNRVLDKGVVISGHVTISIAGIDLLAVDLRLLLSSVQTLLDRRPPPAGDGDHSLLRSRDTEA
jgi:gas vesicle structural protein